MKHHLPISTGTFILAGLIILSSPVSSKEDPFAKQDRDLRKQSLSLQAEPSRTVLNINNIVMNVRKDGFFPWDGTLTGTAGQYPKGAGGLIFAEGMLWGAKVSDGGEVRVRVNGATYASGMKAGKVVFDGDDVIGAEHPDDRQIWRVRRDYKTADLSEDAAIFNVKSVDDVTEAEIQDVFDQYEYDWNNWPAEDGAPFEDVDGNGLYHPTVDIPGEPGASQTIWLVANDVPDIVDATGNVVDTIETSFKSYGSPPIGMEMQLTLWAYDFAATHPLGNMMFKRARLIYTGLVDGPSDARMDTVYFTQWSDPDLGTYTDDYVGSDTTLSLGYVYNGNTLDNDFFTNYGLPVPAGGYDFLQGPVVDGDTLGMTSFTYFGAGSAISDPDLGVYSGTLQFFNLMEGFLPRPEYPVQTPWTDPVTGQITKFVLAGDPVTGEGWVDGIQLPPGDRRLVMATGPFEMALGDTQDVVLALIGGMGADNLSSITMLKYYDVFAQFAYDNNFVLPGPPDKPAVQKFAGDEAVALYWGEDPDAVSATEDVVKGGFEFEGYNVYQLPSATASPSEGVKIATYDLVNGVTVILEKEVDPTTGQVLEVPVQVGSESGIARHITITRDRIRGRPISNDITYYFGVSAYSHYAGETESPFNSLESAPTVVAVIPQKAAPGVRYASISGDTLKVIKGTTNKSDGAVYPIVIDPAALEDITYEVNFNQDLTWNLTANGDTLVSSQTNQSGDDDYPMSGGVVVKVLGPPLEGKEWDYTEGEGTGTRWFSGAGDGELLFGGVYLGANFTGSNVPAAEYKTVEIRWATIEEVVGTVSPGDPYTVNTSHDNASEAATYRTWGAGNFTGIVDVPFSAWDVSGDTPRQLNIAVRDFDGNGQWDPHWISEDETEDFRFNYIWVLDSDYDAGESWDADTEDEDFMAQVDGDGGPVLWALWLSQRGSLDLFQDDGTLTLVPNAVNSPVDAFTFTTEAATTSTDLALEDIDLINVFPNPYYGFHVLEGARGTKYVTFNHLPPKATIRILNLGGTMVKVIEKDDNTQYARWDLRNQNGYPVASGIYIVHIEVPDLNASKVLKLAIVQEAQVLQNY